MERMGAVVSVSVVLCSIPGGFVFVIVLCVLIVLVFYCGDEEDYFLTVFNFLYFFQMNKNCRCLQFHRV